MARILSLDNEPAVLETIQMALELHGYECLTTPDEGEAWQLLSTRSIDLFTQDWERPGLGGKEFLIRMRKFQPFRSIPVLIISAYSKGEFAAVGFNIEQQIDGVLEKPFGMGQLLSIVGSILRKHGTLMPPTALR